MKENFQKKETMIVEIRGICEGYRMEQIFGPVYTAEDELESIWKKHKGNIPFGWESKSYSVYMIDYNKQTILTMELFPERRDDNDKD